MQAGDTVLTVDGPSTDHAKTQLEMRMSLAVFRTVRRPLCPELHWAKGMVASFQAWKQCNFPSGDIGSHERVLFNL